MRGASPNTWKYNILNSLWLYIYCNSISDKICISFTNEDAIYYCLHLNFNTLISCQRVAGSMPVGNIYFHFEFFVCFPSLHVGGALANEIKHVNSPVVIVVLGPRQDES